MKWLSRHTPALRRLLLVAGAMLFMVVLFACAMDSKEIPSAEQVDAPFIVETIDIEKLPVPTAAPGTWSFVNGALSLVGFMEALLALMGFFNRNKVGYPNFFNRSFALRVLAQIIAFTVLVATCISADFSGAAVAFDKMSVLVIVLFVLQQGALYLARGKKGKRRPAAGADGERTEHFRAKKRFEN
jgi:hypothetical protein